MYNQYHININKIIIYEKYQNFLNLFIFLDFLLKTTYEKRYFKFIILSYKD